MSTPAPQPKDYFETLGRNRQQVALGLMIAGAVCAVLSVVVYLIFKSKAESETYALILSGPSAFGLLVLGFACTGAGAWQYFRQEGTITASEEVRIVVLLVGGALGLCVTLHALLLGYIWRATLLGGLEVWQGKDGWRVWLVFTESVVGLIIMFVSLLLARTQEQSSPGLRRLLYGYNAVLTSYLVLFILIIINVLAFNYIPAQADYTDLGIYTLNQKSENILKGLEKPVTVYLIVESYDQVSKDVSVLEQNCKYATNKISFRTLARDMDRTKVAELISKYQLVDDLGMLVVYGDEDEKQESTFVKWSSLYEVRGRGRLFKGENELMSAISFLEEHKTHPIVYFTQANGELDVLGTGEDRRPTRVASILRERLEKDGYEVKGLLLGAAAKEDRPGQVSAAQVPGDAAAVIIAGPRIAFSDEALKALNELMNPADASKKKGKLIVLLDPVVATGEGDDPTKLAQFLTPFNVKARNVRILDAQSNDVKPRNRLALRVNPNLADSNPVAAAFSEQLFYMINVCPVEPTPQAPNQFGGASYRAEPLMVALSPRGLWTSPRIDADPEQLWEEMIKDPRNEKLRVPISMFTAVAVSEGGMEFNPMAPHPMPKESTPRLLVFGSAWFLSDANLGGPGSQRDRMGRSAQAGYPYYDLFASSLAWLRERPSSIGLDPKERKEFRLKEGANINRMTDLPFGLMLVGIVGVGLGVWVVRRR
jgi:hypothetical protein